MKIVLAPNAFKGSLTARQAADAMRRGVLRVLPDCEVVSVPVADGGDGLVDVLADACGGEVRSIPVRDPLGRPITADFLHIPSLDAAAVEMALASGLALLADSERDPTKTSTYGTGEFIKEALSLGVSRILVGIGGSATCDGGSGMAAALGVKFFDASGSLLEPDGGNLSEIASIDISGLDPRISSVRFEAICDVDNPLLGEHGAAQVYGPQKGATPSQVQELEDGLANMYEVLSRDCGLDVKDLPGAGAAGGLGAGLKAFLGAELVRGVDAILDLVDLQGKAAGASLLITAEGGLDSQTVYGKAPAGAADVARKEGCPCFAIAGGVPTECPPLHDAGIDAFFSICPGPVSLSDAMENAGDYLAAATEQAVRAFCAGTAAQ